MVQFFSPTPPSDLSQFYRVVMDFLPSSLDLASSLEGYKLCRNEVKDKRGGMTKKDRRRGQDKKAKDQRKFLSRVAADKEQTNRTDSPRIRSNTFPFSLPADKKAKKESLQVVNTKKVHELSFSLLHQHCFNGCLIAVTGCSWRNSPGEIGLCSSLRP